MAAITRALPQMMLLSRRSILGLWRQPAAWVPGLFFPLMLAAVYSSQFAKTVNIEGFPEVDSFLDFLLPASILQACAFGANTGATDLAVDIEGGFFDRLVSSPVQRVAIFMSRLAGSMAFGAFQALFIGLVFLVFGGSVAGGVPSFVGLMLIGAMLSVAIGSFGVAVALKTGSQEVVQSIFPLVFVMLFVSSAFFPTQLMTGWYQQAAEANPFTWIIDRARRLTIEGFSFTDLGQAVGICAVIALIGTLVSLRLLNQRLSQ